MGKAIRENEPRLAIGARASSSTTFEHIAILLALVSSAPTHAEEKPDWPRALASAIDRLGKGDCEGVWNEVWPFARSGHSEALSFLFGTTLYAIDPPADLPHSGSLGEPFSRRDHGLALAMHGWRSRAPGTDIDATRLVNGLANEYGTSQLKRLAQCMKDHPDKDVCVSMAVELKLIPSFEDYVSLTERAGRPASCVIWDRDYL